MVQEKFYWSQKFVDPEFFHPKKNLVQQNFESEDILSPNKIGVQKMFVSKNLGPKKFVRKKIDVQTKFWIQRFWVHKIVGPKNL